MATLSTAIKSLNNFQKKKRNNFFYNFKANKMFLSKIDVYHQV